jgi:APA family basic amino acid/polyamine antiporter
MAVAPSEVNIWTRKSTDELIAETSEEGHALKKAVGTLDLTAFGIGAIIGTGIFVVLGEGIGDAGPAIVVSFVLAGLTCLFSALSYAELASSIPVSGSAYTYAYATLGELVAWIIGWDLILEYGVSVAAVAVGWGANLNKFLDVTFGFTIPDSIATSPSDGGVVNLVAVAIVMAITWLLIIGVRESARANAIMVGVKLTVLAIFIVVAVTVFNSDHFTPFNTKGTGGIVTGASVIFFAYIGFDAVSTGSEEAKNPKRDLPLAICGSLAICTVIYILVAVTAIGALPAAELAASPTPLATAMDQGAGVSWAASLIAGGAVVAITSVVLTILYGQTRIMFAMCRDGLMPPAFAQVNPRTGTPIRLTLGFGILISVLAALVPLTEIIKLVNVGTLFAFILVNFGVIILRRTNPDMERSFRVPLSPIFPLIGVGLCIYLMTKLPGETWVRFVVWLLVGFVIYFTYSRTHSRLRTGDAPPTETELPPGESL